MKKNILTVILTVVVVLVVLFISLFAVVNSNQASKDYQAVFLTNGQVYFGKLSHEDQPTVILTDIYYLQQQQALQQNNSSTEQPKIQLVKLGSEIHGPADEMRISRQQILFIEALRNDGKVVAAIHNYQANDSNSNTSTNSSSSIK